MAVIDPGDEVIIPAPYWVSYPDMALLAEGTPVTPYAGPEQGYKITPAQLEAAITPKTRLFMLNSPSNPTGAAYTSAELHGARRGAAPAHRTCSSPPTTCTSTSTGRRSRSRSFLTACPDLYDRTVTINGVSKSYAMTGWRIGYCGGPATIIDAMSTIQSQSTSNPSSIAQKAAIAALNGDQACVGRDEPALQGAARLLHRRPERPARLPRAARLPARSTRCATSRGAIQNLGLARRPRLRRVPARQGRRRRRAGLRLRRPGPHPLLVRREHADAGEGPRAHGQGAARG